MLYNLERLMNVWLPANFWGPIKNHVHRPVIICFMHEGRPRLELKNAKDIEPDFDMFFMPELPEFQIPADKEEEPVPAEESQPEEKKDAEEGA